MATIDLAPVDLPTRKQHRRFSEGLSSYRIPPRYRGTTLFSTPYLPTGLDTWLHHWQKGDVLATSGKGAGRGVTLIGPHQVTTPVAAALVQDALRLSAGLNISPLRAALWVSSISGMHDSLRKPDTESGYLITFEQIVRSYLLVLPDLDPSHTYAQETVDRIIRVRAEKSLPTIITVTAPNLDLIRTSLSSLLTEMTVPVAIGG